MSAAPPLSACALHGAKPCPFCGSLSILAEEPPGLELRYSLDCHDCNAIGPAGGTMAQAVERWNQRPAKTVQPSRGDIVRMGLQAGFAFSNVVGREAPRLMPMTDDATLAEFAKLVLQWRAL